MIASGLSAPPPFARSDGAAAGWAVSPGLVDYPAAVAAMEARAAAVAEGAAGELVWLLEHPPIYTAGVSARPHDLLAPDRFPVHASGRGGQYTYHGPGQRVAYVMLDLRARRRDVRGFVQALEAWVVGALGALGVEAEVRPGRVGVWVRRPGVPAREDKIAAIGVRIRRWVSFHGVSLNVAPELEHFSGIVPCGIAPPEVSGHGVTSLSQLGRGADLNQADAALKASFQAVFGPLRAEPPPV